MNNDTFTQQIEHIQKEFKALGGQVSQLASMSTERLQEYKTEAIGEAKHMAEDVSREAQKQAKRADEYAHTNPWAVVAGASVVGFLIGALFSKKK
ncbi:MAG: hypothetical protein A3C02_04365 [Candidatus Andersenbacteria bacterium RIFCSPHIGHO2_02_FULL_45_11]|uniref:DUF883 domain-containing protein n=1 Tax=Candidatus Andersenbacteria bacterium RIFCSPHIGHO2_12_FULL_45_11 TaxID=1797281 RepID=A0A1G1X1M4_9BACT|nr:MAG: hypothetical protein A3C02_04365 [Candidatus Andersenbacteria bacterium RIFCSPHIGHO2_02_FULL_45_11]OGY33450.1 MAG: hypothetical protein A3D99_04895 [Candidatus Andersenbacteria bacterium RIFCSPHIGHO2_12_FULL_45_11]